MLVLQNRVNHACVSFFSWPYWLFEQKEDLDKGIYTISSVMLSNRVHHWIGLGGGGLTSRRGKSHIGNFGLATNLSLFILGCFCILCCVPHNSFYF
jgi:hypothetical protein